MIFMTFFFSSRIRHTRYWRDWSSDVCSSDLRGDKAGRGAGLPAAGVRRHDPRHAGLAGALPEDAAVAVRRRTDPGPVERSEERRVGKESRSRWSPDN